MKFIFLSICICCIIGLTVQVNVEIKMEKCGRILKGPLTITLDEASESYIVHGRVSEDKKAKSAENNDEPIAPDSETAIDPSGSAKIESGENEDEPIAPDSEPEIDPPATEETESAEDDVEPDKDRRSAMLYPLAPSPFNPMGPNHRTDRTDKNLGNFYYMVSCATKCSLNSYNNYGCWCGAGGGRGGAPVNNIDRCCKVHKECYARTGCNWFSKYLTHYSWTCSNARVPVCHSSRRDCSGQLCECDRKFTMCIRQYPCPRSTPRCSQY